MSFHSAGSVEGGALTKMTAGGCRAASSEPPARGVHGGLRPTLNTRPFPSVQAKTSGPASSQNVGVGGPKEAAAKTPPSPLAPIHGMDGLLRPDSSDDRTQPGAGLARPATRL